jgi:hypothetical protein
MHFGADFSNARERNKNDNGHVSSIYQHIDAHEITQYR